MTLVGFCFILYCSAGFLIPVSSGFPEFWNPFCVQAPALLAQFEISAPASISDHSNYLCVMVLGGYISIQVTPMSGIWLPVLFFHAIRCAWWLGPSVTPMCFYSSPKCAWYKCLDSRFYSSALDCHCSCVRTGSLNLQNPGLTTTDATPEAQIFVYIYIFFFFLFFPTLPALVSDLLCRLLLTCSQTPIPMGLLERWLLASYPSLLPLQQSISKLCVFPRPLPVGR